MNYVMINSNTVIFIKVEGTGENLDGNNPLIWKSPSNSWVNLIVLYSSFKNKNKLGEFESCKQYR
jgi:hypothetical protein